MLILCRLEGGYNSVAAAASSSPVWADTYSGLQELQCASFALVTGSHILMQLDIAQCMYWPCTCLLPTAVTVAARVSVQPYVAEQQSALMFELHCLATQLLLLELTL